MKLWDQYIQSLGATHRHATLIVHKNSQELITYEICKDGKIRHNGELLDPQPKAVVQDWIKQNYKELTAQSEAQMPVPHHLAKIRPGDGSGTYYYIHNKDNQLLYVRQRLEPKKFLTWTVQKDAWTSYPVPSRLPMFGNWHDRSRVMIHEGEKACSAAMSQDHPWASNLKFYGHAAVAGANARPELEPEVWNGVEVYVVPDHDEGGERGADHLCRALDSLGATVFRLSYANLELPEKWDMADSEYCQAPRSRRQSALVRWTDLRWKYAGPATQVVEDPDTGKKAHVIQDKFVSQFCLITGSQHIYDRRRPLYPMSTSQFNHAYAHLSPVPLANLLTKHSRLMKVDRAGYHPGKETGSGYKEDGFTETYLNTHISGEVRPSPGSVRPWLEFIRHLIPDRQHRRILLQWMALMIGAPEERYYRFAPLLVSEVQGVGKTTIAEFLGYIIGHSNVAVLNTEKATEKHNGWLLSARLLVVEELLETGSRFRLYESLKEYITNDHVSVRGMGVESYPFKTRLAVLAFSNHKDALQLSSYDRRWFIPEVTEQKEYDFHSLRQWFFLDGGAEALLHAAQRWATVLIPRILDRKDLSTGLHSDAPMTGVKQEMLEMTKADWKLAIDEVLDEIGARVVVLADLHAWLRETRKGCPTSPKVIGGYLKASGMHRLFDGRVSIKEGKAPATLYSKVGHDTPTEAKHHVRWFTHHYEQKYHGEDQVF